MGVVSGRRRTPDTSTNEWYEALQVDNNGRLLLASHNTTTIADRTEEIDPVSQHFEPDQDGATGQTDGTTYYYYNMAGFKFVAFQIADTPGVAGDQTYTVEASVQDDGTAAGSCTYTDVTNALYGVANLVTSGQFHPSIPLVAKWVRIKVVRANDGANNDGAWTIDSKRMY